MPMKRLHRGWVDVPTAKRVHGPLTLTPEQITKLEEWAMALQERSNDKTIRPKDRDMAAYALSAAARLFRSMGLVAVTGIGGMRLYELMTEEQIAAVETCIDHDDAFYDSIRRTTSEYY